MATTPLLGLVFAATVATALSDGLAMLGGVKSVFTVNENPNSTEEYINFKKDFPLYEKKINTFIDSVGQTYSKINSENTQFMGTLGKYEDRLPKNETRQEIVYFRSRCWCEDRYWVPCPARCMNSCETWEAGEFKTYLNCTQIEGQTIDCYCDPRRTTSCNEGQELGQGVLVSLCYENKTVEVQVDEPCRKSLPDRSLVEWSYTQFFELLLEPLKKLVRTLQFQMALLKQTIADTDDRYDIITQKCQEQGKTQCPEAQELLTNQMVYFKQLQVNMSIIMDDTRQGIEKADEDVFNLREQTLTQVNLTIRNYTCCMKALNFTVPDIDCSPSPQVPTTISPFTLLGRKQRMEN